MANIPSVSLPLPVLEMLMNPMGINFQFESDVRFVLAYHAESDLKPHKPKQQKATRARR